MKLHKKQGGAVGSKEELELEDDNSVSRDSRRSKLIAKKVKSGQLNIDHKSGDEEDLDEIKFWSTVDFIIKSTFHTIILLLSFILLDLPMIGSDKAS